MSDKQMDQISPVCCVGLGASAGGLEALDQFFDAMPAQSGLAFVVVQHLSPDYKSLMAELLSKHTQMEVVRAEDGMAIASNHVYIIPPRKDIRLFKGKLQLSDQVRDERGINLPIDVFFQSLAQDLKDRSVGIVLSGTGSDGARGIRAIKEVGGLTVAQSAETARFDGMPRAAVATGLVDFVLPVAEMPGKLMSFVDHPYLAAQTPRSPLLLEEDRLARVFAMLREQARVDFTLYKQSTIARRIERRMTVNQIVELSDYVSFMENRPSEVMSLYRELLIGVTSFFRDPDVWEALLTKHLTKLLSESESDEVRMWVAGCSTGEEAYTLAMVCHEVMTQLDRQFDIKIFATDIDRDAIGRASTGVYPEAVIGDMTPQRVTRFFNRHTEQVKVVRAIREMVVFAHHNLITDPPFTNLDLVCCRNLLIYLQPVLQQKIIDGFNFSLHTDALLVLGSSETTGDMSENFDCLDSKLKIFRSRGQARRGRRGFAMPLAADRLGLSGKGVLGRRGYQPGRQDDKLMERLLDTLAQGMIPLSMVVNEQSELLHVVGETAGILTLPSGKVHNDITRMVVGELGVPLATGLRRIFDTGQEVKYKNIRMERGGEDVAIDLTVRKIAGRHNQENLALISVEEQGAIPQPREGTPSAEFDVASAND
nr:chemotaxis protein CheB [Candidatus Krumholzibacteria bacterium]